MLGESLLNTGCIKCVTFASKECKCVFDLKVFLVSYLILNGYGYHKLAKNNVIRKVRRV